MRFYFCSPNRGVEQLVARWAHNPKVTGSSPVPATKNEKSGLIGRFFILYLPSTAIFDFSKTDKGISCPRIINEGKK
jgi:hypothetical protein